MNAIEDLTIILSRLPGLGKKSASRIAFHILKSDTSYAERLAHAIIELKTRIRFCSSCGSYTENDPCPVCSNPQRDKTLLCVVERPEDVITVEASREFNGMYHVLGGVISPLDGIGPEKLKISELITRLRSGSFREIIIATNPTVEGDTTALYLQRVLKDIPVSVTRLASGIQVGGDLEYADRLTLARSFRGRVKM